jgi:hypothetical protein
MVVKPRSSRQRMTGLHIDDDDVQRLFPPDVTSVELELDHLRIVCALQPEFWEGESDIHDDRLVSWLEAKRMSGKLAPQPAPLVMIPAGDHAFRLMPVTHKEARTAKYPVGFSG